MTLTELRPWWVVSPEMASGGTYDPPEYGRDVAYVEAATQRDAIRAGVKRMETRCWAARGGQGCHCWPHSARRDGCNPFAGVTAEISLCVHGQELWMLDENAEDEARPACPDCEEWKRGRSDPD